MNMVDFNKIYNALKRIQDALEELELVVDNNWFEMCKEQDDNNRKTTRS
jgi:hypothetical protein